VSTTFKLTVSDNLVRTVPRMFRSQVDVLHELLQNSYRAGADLVTIQIAEDGRSLVYVDDGYGMNLDQIRSALTFGESGWNGAFIDPAGVGFASVLQDGVHLVRVLTHPIGETVIHQFELTEDHRDRGADVVVDTSEDVGDDWHGTQIEIYCQPSFTKPIDHRMVKEARSLYPFEVRFNDVAVLAPGASDGPATTLTLQYDKGWIQLTRGGNARVLSTWHKHVAPVLPVWDYRILTEDQVLEAAWAEMVADYPLTHMLMRNDALGVLVHFDPVTCALRPALPSRTMLREHAEVPALVTNVLQTVELYLTTVLGDLALAVPDTFSLRWGQSYKSLSSTMSYLDRRSLATTIDEPEWIVSELVSIPNVWEALGWKRRIFTTPAAGGGYTMENPDEFKNWSADYPNVVIYYSNRDHLVLYDRAIADALNYARYVQNQTHAPYVSRPAEDTESWMRLTETRREDMNLRAAWKAMVMEIASKEYVSPAEDSLHYLLNAAPFHTGDAPTPTDIPATAEVRLSGVKDFWELRLVDDILITVYPGNGEEVLSRVRYMFATVDSDSRIYYPDERGRTALIAVSYPEQALNPMSWDDNILDMVEATVLWLAVKNRSDDLLDYTIFNGVEYILRPTSVSQRIYDLLVKEANPDFLPEERNEQYRLNDRRIVLPFIGHINDMLKAPSVMTALDSLLKDRYDVKKAKSIARRLRSVMNEVNEALSEEE